MNLFFRSIWFGGGFEVLPETSVWARRNSTPSGESSAKILLELGHHALEMFCVWIRFDPYVLACLELREIHAYLFGRRVLDKVSGFCLFS
jgi:hypothetical protein